MSERNRWLPVIVILSLIGTGVAAPALARDGVNTFGVARFSSGFVMHAPRPFMRNSIVTPHIAARNADVQNDLRFRRHTRLQNGLPITSGRIRHSPMQRHWTFLRVKTKAPQARRSL